MVATAVPLKLIAEFRDSLPSVFRARAPLPGPAFDAVQEGDGTFTIKRLPVFCPCLDDRPLVINGIAYEPRDYTPGWCYEAVAYHQEQQALNYYAPCRINHPGRGGNQLVGLFANHCMGFWPHPETGELTETIFADVIKIPASVFQEIQEFRLPYRSVEIPPERFPGGPERPGFSGLAMLDSFEPYFHFTVNNVRLSEMGRTQSGDGWKVLIGDTEEGYTSMFFAFPQGVASMPKDRQKAMFQDDPAAEEAAVSEGAEGAEAPSGMEAKLDKILELLMQLLPAPAPEENQLPIAAPASEPSPAEAAGFDKQGAKGFVTVAEFAKLSAENQGLRQRLDGIETQKVIDDTISRWKDQRYAFDEGRTRQEASVFAAKGSLKEYLEATETTLKQFGQAPPSSGMAHQTATEADAIDPKDEALGVFSKMAPAVQGEAKRYAEMWEKDPKLQRDYSKKAFVEGIMSAELRDAASSNDPEASNFARDRISLLRQASGMGNG